MNRQGGKVWLAGAGPGDAGLLTVKAKEMLSEADVIVYDALVSGEILCQIPPEKELLYVGKRAGSHFASQEEINQILLKEAEKGKKVLRLKGGDPFVFGRGGEELEALAKAGIPFEMIPGITSATAVPAYAGIPVTHRDYSSSFYVVTGHAKKGKGENIDFSALVRISGTLVFVMGVASAGMICAGLLEAGMPPDTPAAALERGTTSRQRRVVSDVAHLAEAVQQAQIHPPAILMTGKVCALAETFGWAEDRVLGGRQFLITRPRQNSSSLAGELRRLGAQVLELPSIRTKVITPNLPLWKAVAAFGKKTREAWLVFTSPVGVQTFFGQMKEQGTDMRTLFSKQATVKLAAIGSATERALGQFCLHADLVPEVYDAKHLGNLLAKEALPGSEVLIPRAAAGSKDLLPPLEEAGLPVTDLPIYETEYELHEPIRKHIVKTLDAGEIDAVTFTSVSTVRGFVQAIRKDSYAGIRAICIGSQTAAEAKKYGMHTMISQKASIGSMTELICETFGSEDSRLSR